MSRDHPDQAPVRTRTRRQFRAAHHGHGAAGAGRRRRCTASVLFGWPAIYPVRASPSAPPCWPRRFCAAAGRTPGAAHP
ncbi:MAG: hypothetical protein MZV65_00440 [Chromatiales bacterium]|nr:hypothetical protein [Chromatiales bacterium]